MTCPDREELLAYLRKEAGPDLAAHVEGCEACLAEVERLGQLDEAQRGLLTQAAALPSIPAEEAERALSPLAEAAPGTAVPPTAPRRLGIFELLQRLGAPSGQGEVWLARHLLLQCLCAVKLLRADRQGCEALARFMREMELYAQLDHPNIVGVRHAELIDGQPILVMKYVDGFSLHDLVRRHGPLPVADACELIRQAALGSQHAHEHGIVHRDFKPSNLMLDRTLTVKVLDFGLARRPPAAEGEALTQDGAALGTPEYMAPEQAGGAAQVDIRADLYALGCTLFFLLRGRPPYPMAGGDWVDVLNRHRNAPVPSVRKRRPDVPEALAHLIEKQLLAKNPGARLNTPAELAAALKAFAAGHRLDRLLGVVALPVGASAGDAKEDLMPTRFTAELEAPLDAALDLLFWDAARRAKVSLQEPGVLPVKQGDEFQVEVRLSRPGYVYLVWIDSEGKVGPVYPWKPGSAWEAGAAEEKLDRLLLPAAGAEGYGTWSIRGVAGVETLVLMAHDEPLSASEQEDLPGRFPPRFPRLAALTDPARPRWLTCRQEECLAGGGQRGFDPSPRAPADPLFQIDSLLRDRLGTRFRLVHAVCFTNQGPPGGNP